MKKRIPEAGAKSFSSDQSCFIARVTHSNLREDTLVGTSDLPLISFESYESSYTCFNLNFTVFSKEVFYVRWSEERKQQDYCEG